MKKKQDRFLGEVNDYKLKKVKLEKTLLKNEIAMKAMTRSVVDLVRDVYHLKTEKSFLMKRNEEPVSYLSPTSTGSGRMTNMLLKHIPPVYLELVLNIWKTILRYFSRNVLQLLSFISELRRN